MDALIKNNNKGKVETTLKGQKFNQSSASPINANSSKFNNFLFPHFFLDHKVPRKGGNSCKLPAMKTKGGFSIDV